MAVLSKDGDMIAFVPPAEVDPSGRLWVRRLQDLHALPVAGTEGATAFDFSPTGDRIAFGRPGEVAIASLDETRAPRASPAS
jgi:hypothetical protein